MESTIWAKYKVFILGLVAAIAVALQEYLSSNTEPNMKVYAFAALMAGLSYIATQWRGKNMTILGVVGTLAGVFVSLNQTGTFTWNQFILYGISAALASVAPPPKPSTYEHNENIVAAKEIPPVEQVTDSTKIPIGTIQTAAPNDAQVQNTKGQQK